MNTRDTRLEISCESPADHSYEQMIYMKIQALFVFNKSDKELKCCLMHNFCIVLWVNFLDLAKRIVQSASYRGSDKELKCCLMHNFCSALWVNFLDLAKRIVQSAGYRGCYMTDHLI